MSTPEERFRQLEKRVHKGVWAQLWGGLMVITIIVSLLFVIAAWQNSSREPLLGLITTGAAFYLFYRAWRQVRDE